MIKEYIRTESERVFLRALWKNSANYHRRSRFRAGRRHRGCIHDAGDFIGLVCRTGQTGTRVAELGIRTGLDDVVFPYWNFFVSGLEK